MSFDLSSWVPAVPDAVVAALAAGREVLVVSHENPDADTLGAALAVRTIVERNGGRASAVCTDPVPPLYSFLPGVETVSTDPDPRRAYDLLVIVDCGTLDRVGAVRPRHPKLFAELPRVIIDHHLSNAGDHAADWIDPGAAATCEMVTLLAARLGVPLDTGEGSLATVLMAGIVMDTATFAHPNATPRTLAVAAALVEAGAPLSEISRRLYRSKPDSQLRLFGRVLDRLESADHGRVVWSTLTDADLASTGTDPAHSEGIIDLLSQAEEAEVAILFKEQGSATRISVRTQAGWGRCDGPDRRLRRRRARPGGRGDGRRSRWRGRARRSSPRLAALADAVAPVSRGAPRNHAPGLDGILVVAKPAGPTSHDIVALVRRLTGTKRVGHGGTLDPFATGVLPLFLGRATRLVEYHLGDRKAYRATICFGARRRPTTSTAS